MIVKGDQDFIWWNTHMVPVVQLSTQLQSSGSAEHIGHMLISPSTFVLSRLNLKLCFWCENECETLSNIKKKQHRQI